MKIKSTMSFLLQSVKNSDKAGVMEALKLIKATVTRLTEILLQTNGNHQCYTEEYFICACNNSRS